MKDLLRDSDVQKVMLAGLVPTTLSLAQVSYLVTIAAGLCSIAYTLKKWRGKHRRKRSDEDTDL